MLKNISLLFSILFWLSSNCSWIPILFMKLTDTHLYVQVLPVSIGLLRSSFFYQIVEGCANQRSWTSIRASMTKKVVTWIRSSVDNPEKNRFFSSSIPFRYFSRASSTKSNGWTADTTGKIRTKQKSFIAELIWGKILFYIHIYRKNKLHNFN